MSAFTPHRALRSIPSRSAIVPHRQKPGPDLSPLPLSGSGEPPGERFGGDGVVRGVPDGRASLEHDDLGRLVFHARARRDLLRHGALCANVHEIRRNVRMLKEEGFDLAQGRHARGSGRAMLVQERTLRGEDMFQFPLVIDLPHASPFAAVRDGGAGSISTCMSIIPGKVFQPADGERPHEGTLTSLPQMPDRSRIEQDALARTLCLLRFPFRKRTCWAPLT